MDVMLALGFILGMAAGTHTEPPDLMQHVDVVSALRLLVQQNISIRAKECNYDEFAICMRDVKSIQGGDFNIVGEEEMKEVCNSKMETIQCASDFIRNCMKPGERDLYEATTGGRLKVVEEMCTDGTQINQGFLQHMGCFGRLQDEIDFCNEKFKESQTLLDKAKMVERLKVFYGCCAFEWHRNCLAKTARMKCNDEASNFMYYVTTVLGGEVQNAICKTSYSSCHGLHGVDQDEIDEKLENISGSALLTSAALQTVILLCISTCLTIIYRKNHVL